MRWSERRERFRDVLRGEGCVYYGTLKALRAGVPPAEVAGIATDDMVKRLTRDVDYRRNMKEFLGG